MLACPFLQPLGQSFRITSFPSKPLLTLLSFKEKAAHLLAFFLFGTLMPGILQTRMRAEVKKQHAFSPAVWTCGWLNVLTCRPVVWLLNDSGCLYRSSDNIYSTIS